MNSPTMFEDISEGMSSSYWKIISDKDVIEFSELTGDRNPVHLDDSYAEATIFKKRVAHGMLAGSLFSTIFGSQFPGAGCIYLEQSLSFRKPVFLNDKVIATVTVTEIDGDRRRVTFETKCEVSGQVVITGIAKILVP